MPGNRKAPQIKWDIGFSCFTSTSSTKPSGSQLTASNSCGLSTGNKRNENCDAGSWLNPSVGNQIVSGNPINTSSSGEMKGKAVNNASHKPLGFCCTA